MFNKEELRQYLLDDKLSTEEKLERFEIAWDIWKNFEEIKFEMKKKIFEKLINKLINELSSELSNKFDKISLEVYDNGFLKGEKYGNIIITDTNWKLNRNDKKGILNFTLESDLKNIFNLGFGITKYDDSKGIPFKNRWNLPEVQKKLNPQILNILNKIFETVNKNFNFKWNISEWWIIWKNFESYYFGVWEFEFYKKVIENPEKVINYYYENMKKLIEVTYTDIAKIIKIYKNGNV